MKTFSINEYEDGEYVQNIGEVEAETLEEAVKEAFDQFLTKEQIENVDIINSNEYGEFYRVITLHYNKDGDLLTEDQIENMDEDYYSSISSEIGIELED